MAHDVFISYSSRDRTVANAVCATLEGRRIRCWIAPRDVLPGQAWAASLVQAIDESTVFVLVYSSGANASRQVIREVERAISRGVPVIPLRVEDVAPSAEMGFFLTGLHWLDALTPPLEAHLQRLGDRVDAVLRTGGMRPEGVAEPGPAEFAAAGQAAPVARRATAIPRPAHKTWWIVAAAAVVVLFAAAWLLRRPSLPDRSTAPPSGPTVTAARGAAPTDSAPAAGATGASPTTGITAAANPAPTPTLTARAAPAPGASPTLSITLVTLPPTLDAPADWITREDAGGAFTFRHPPDWVLDPAQSGAGRTTFKVQVVQVASLLLVDRPAFPEMGDIGAVGPLCDYLVESFGNSGYEVRFTGGGVWSAPHRGYFCGVILSGTYQVLISEAARDADHCFSVVLMKPASLDPYNGADVELAARLVASVRFK